MYHLPLPTDINEDALKEIRTCHTFLQRRTTANIRRENIVTQTIRPSQLTLDFAGSKSPASSGHATERGHFE